MPNTSPTPKAFTQNRSGNGTKQWSDVSYNICKGCSHDCIYCYAKSMAWRFAGGNLNWSAMVVDPQKVAKAARKFPGVVMFPTSHDITPAILPACLTTLKNMLSAPVASTAPAAPPANKISITSVPSKPMVMVIIINKRAAKKIP